MQLGGFVRSDHLSEAEIDALLDGDPGLIDSAASAHLHGCTRCASEFAIARMPLDALERLPHLEPSSAFANRVMSQVRVFEPIHVTVIDELRRLIPSGTPARVAVGSVVASIGLVLTATFVWIGTRADAVVFLTGLLLEKGRIAAIGAAQSLAVTIVGEQTAEMLNLSGMRGVWFTMGLLGASTLISAMGLRAVASAARRRRG
jgi:anti-sigma factor RsiW